MTSSTSSATSTPPPVPSSGATTTPNPKKPDSPTDKKTAKVASKARMSSNTSSARLSTTSHSATFQEADKKKHKRRIGGQKIHEVTAKDPRRKESVEIEPTEWKGLTKVKDFAVDKILWPKGHWKWLSIPGWVVTGVPALVGLGSAYGAKAAYHRTKWMGANTFNGDTVEDPAILRDVDKKRWYSRWSRKAVGKPYQAAKWLGKNAKWPPPLYNISPFRSKDFIELSEEEKDKFCEQMDKAWESYQKAYNKGKPKAEQIHSQDVVRWIFEVPKKRGGRFGFKIIHRIPVSKTDKKGRVVKGAKDQKRKYQVDKDGYFDYKSTYIFWGKLDLDDLDNVYVEATTTVDDWEEIGDRKRFRAPTLALLKQKIKESTIVTPAPEADEDSTTSNNCWLHTGLESIMLDSRLKRAFQAFIGNSSEEREKLFAKLAEKDESVKKRALLMIACLEECQGKTAQEKEKIIKKHSAEIRKAFGFTSGSEEEALDLHRTLIEFFERLGLLPSFPATINRKLKQLDPLAPMAVGAPFDLSSKRDTQGVIELDVPDTTEIAVTQLMTRKVPVGDRTLDDFSINDDGKRANYLIDEEETTFEDEPEAITYHIKHHKAKDGTKTAHTLKAVPLTLEFKDKKFVPNPDGTYELKYAIIHNGRTTDSGHYYVIYQDDKGKWHKINDSIETDISEEEAKKSLENAVYLHYEPSLR